MAQSETAEEGGDGSSPVYTFPSSNSNAWYLSGASAAFLPM